MDDAIIQRQYHLKHCVPLSRVRISHNNPNLLCNLGFWVSKVSEGFCLKSIDCTNTDSAFHHSSSSPNQQQQRPSSSSSMEDFINVTPKKKDSHRDSSCSSDFLSSETPTRNEEQSRSSTAESSASASASASSPPSEGWPVQKTVSLNCTDSSRGVLQDCKKKQLMVVVGTKKQDIVLPEMEMMRERFARLLLGEDMSGCGNGVAPALAISNSITNLCGTLFGQILRLEPVAEGKKAMWRREMEWLLSVSDHIVELAPTCQTHSDGTKLEIMSCRPRSDLYVNLPALRKLDNMLLEILDGFVNTEFWYVDQGVVGGPHGGTTDDSSSPSPSSSSSSSSSSSIEKGRRGRGGKREEEKWWLPVPRVPPCGIHHRLRKKLQNKRDCTHQIQKAAMAINTATLADMDIPDSYLDSLPKTARACLGDVIYGHITSDQFSPDCVIDCLDVSSEHQAIEIADKVEASIHIWRRRANIRPSCSSNNSSNSSSTSTARYSTKTSWEMVKDLMVDADKWELLAERAESILVSLRQRFPGLPQTTLDITKIQHNKDVGKAILESYSRVLESVAYNIVARIDDVMYVDDLTKYCGDRFTMPMPTTPSRAMGTPSRTSFTNTPTMTTPTRVPKSPLKPENGNTNMKTPQRTSAKRILTDFLTIERPELTTKTTFKELSAFELKLT